MKTYSRRGALGLGAALAVTLLAACSEHPTPRGDRIADPAKPKLDLASDDAAASAYQAGVRAFALDMLAQAQRKSTASAVISPLSISQCLAMVAQGADGETLDQLAAALGCDDSDQLRSGANAEITALAALAKTEIDLANASFTDDRLSVEAQYQQVLTDYFGVAAHKADFTDPAGARKQINQWVAQRTHDKIQQLIGDNQLSEQTRQVLVNALYLKALWRDPFDPADTSPDEFTRDDGKTIQVPMMSDERDTKAVIGADGELLFELPYTDDDLAALCYLPPSGTPLPDALSALTDARLDELSSQLTKQGASLRIPTFELRQSIPLDEALQSAGIKLAFDPELADFSRLSKDKTSIDLVQHEAWLKVGEKGTEGAAATAGSGEAGAAPSKAEPVKLHVDRPFVFLVRMRSTRSVLFAAAIADPSKG